MLMVTAAWCQDDSLAEYYSYDSRVVIDKFEREHIPLNGNEVSMIPFRVDDKYGFVKNDGRQTWLIKPKYQEVFAVYKEGAIVKKDDGYGLLNSKDDFIIPAYYQNLLREGPVFHGLIDGVIDTSLPENYNSCIFNQYFNPSGVLLFTVRSHEQQTFIGDDTLAWFRFGKQYSVYSRSGRLMNTFRVDEKKRFAGICDNLLVFYSAKLSGYQYEAFDINGHLVFSMLLDDEFYKGVYRLDENQYGILAREGEYYFCDSLGIKRPYGVYSDAIGFYDSDPAYFKQEYFTVADKETLLKGVINRKGDHLIDLKYKYVSGFVDGLCFCMNEKDESFFINTKGETVITADPGWAMPTIKHCSYGLQEPVGFHDSLCLGVNFMLMHDSIEGKWVEYTDPDSLAFFFIDHSGKIVLKVPYQVKFMAGFSEGLAPALNSDGGLGFIDKKGSWKIKPLYELSMAGAYPLPYLVIPEFKGGLAYIKSFKGYIDKDGREYFSGQRMQDHYDFSH
jgi:hypothetical protein